MENVNDKQLWISIVLWIVLGSGGPVSAALAGDVSAAATPAITTASVETLVELKDLSRALVKKAASGSSPAHQFRVETTLYREMLRRFMLDDRTRAPRQRAPRDLLLQMVRMSALLHSASECKTGFVITCPPDLMYRLRSQQQQIDQALAKVSP